jgi:hypothetical protein
VDLGNIALVIVAIVVPLRAAITQHREARVSAAESGGIRLPYDHPKTGGHMKKLHHLGPVFIVAAFPALLLTIQSTNILRAVWFAAMFGLASMAGESLERLFSRDAAWGLAIAGTIAAPILFSSLNYGPAGTPLDLGKFALLAVAIVMPVSALRIKYRKT